MGSEKWNMTYASTCNRRVNSKANYTYKHIHIYYTYIVIFQLLSSVWLFATPRTEACQASLSFTISWSLLKLMSIELVMPSSHLILCYLIRINIIPLTAGFSLANWVPWRRCWPCAGATRCSWVNSSSGCCGRLPQSSFRTEVLFGKR